MAHRTALRPVSHLPASHPTRLSACSPCRLHQTQLPPPLRISPLPASSLSPATSPAAECSPHGAVSPALKISPCPCIGCGHGQLSGAVPDYQVLLRPHRHRRYATSSLNPTPNTSDPIPTMNSALPHAAVTRRIARSAQPARVISGPRGRVAPDRAAIGDEMVIFLENRAEMVVSGLL